MRPLDPLPCSGLDELDDAAVIDLVSKLWLRADRPVLDSALLHTCLRAYVSDVMLSEPVLVARRTTALGPGSAAYLDHAMWFYRITDLADWHLYEKPIVRGAARCGVVSGRLFTRSGDLVATVRTT